MKEEVIRNKRKDIHPWIQRRSLSSWLGSSGGGRVPGYQGFWWWESTARGWPPLLLYLLGACLVTSRKFSKMSQWAWGEGLGGLTVPLLKASA